MKGYVKQALEELKHIFTGKHHYTPSKIDRPDYRAKVQFTKIDTATPLSLTQIKHIKRVVGKFLYYARAIDNTMLNTLNDTQSSKRKSTQTTWEPVKYFLNYAASNPNAEIIFRTSDMLHKIGSDAAYLVCLEARNQAGGYHYLGNADDNIFNEPIRVVAKIIKNFMSLAAESKVAGLFMNAQHTVPICRTLEDMGYPQPPTPICTENLAAQGILSGVYKQKRSKYNYMNFHCIRCSVKQKQFKVTWGPGKKTSEMLLQNITQPLIMRK